MTKYFNLIPALILVLFSNYSLRAQSNESREVITPMQAGTAVIKDGIATINLNKDIVAKLGNNASQTSYYVTLTAQGNTGGRATVQKSEESFIIHLNSHNHNPISDATFDYIVFVKETVPAMMRLKPGAGAWPALKD